MSTLRYCNHNINIPKDLSIKDVRKIMEDMYPKAKNAVLIKSAGNNYDLVLSYGTKNGKTLISMEP